MNFLTDAISKSLSVYAEPVVAVKQAIEGAALSVYYTWCGHKVAKYDARYNERMLPDDAKVPDKTNTLVKQFLAEKGIDVSKIMVKKRSLEGAQDKDYSQWGSIELHNVCVLSIPKPAIDRIEKDGKLSNTDKFALLHEYGHCANNDYRNRHGYSPLKVGMVRLGTYAVSVTALSQLCSFPVAHSLSSVIAHAAGFFCANVLKQQSEFQADEYAAKFGADDLDNGIEDFREQVKHDKSVGRPTFFELQKNAQNELEFRRYDYSETGEFHFPEFYGHPSAAARLAALEKLKSSAVAAPLRAT